MKLVAQKHIHLADKAMEGKSGRYRQIQKGEEFEIDDKEAKPLMDRKIALKPSDDADVKAAKEEAEKKAAGSKAAA